MWENGICVMSLLNHAAVRHQYPRSTRTASRFGDEQGMIYTDSIVLDGVTGSVPGARTDIDQIIARKKTADDFDVLLVQDMSRFTRGGAEHGMKLEYDLNAAGIEVIFVADRLPDGDHSGIIKSVGFYAAQQYAKSLSFAVTRGLMSSMEQGRIADGVHTPYGIDRLLVSLDNQPLHIIRNFADGTQQKLHPDTGEVLATFEAERGQKRSILTACNPMRRLSSFLVIPSGLMSFANVPPPLNRRVGGVPHRPRTG